MFRQFNLAICVWVLVCLTGCQRASTKSLEISEPTVLPVRVASIQRLNTFSIPVTFYGRIQASRESILSFELPGQLKTLLVDEGDTVKQGQLLATLNTDILMARRKLLAANKNVEQAVLDGLKSGERPEVIAAAKASVERLKIEVKRASINEQREKKLLDSKSISRSRYDQLLYDYEALKSSLKEKEARLEELLTGTREEDILTQEQRVLRADAEIEVLNTQLKKSQIIAPFDGEILSRAIDDGTVVDAGQPVLLAAESRQREARFSIPVEFLDRAKQIRQVIVSGSKIPVDSIRVVSKVDAITRSVDVVFPLNMNEELITGKSCVVEMNQPVTQECVVLPVNSLVPGVRGLWSCFRIEKTAEHEFQVVKEDITVEFVDGDSVYASSSMSDQDQIVVGGAQKLVPGMRVQPMSESP